jgi:16S rRNA (cytidine1402-2'-O)-methyltransferase
MSTQPPMPSTSGRASPSKGRLFLMPNTLDFGLPQPHTAPIQLAIPDQVLAVAASLTHWVAENAKTTRAFLKRVGELHPLSAAMQDIRITELPRAPKGKEGSGQAPGTDSTKRSLAGASAPLEACLAPALAGHDLGLISEAGLPAVADPGAALVATAHRLGIEVCALSGPSSLMLALASSGLNGQSFAFVGYLPTDAQARRERLKALEQHSRREGQTQMVIETPYRNPSLLEALVKDLQAQTRLSVSVGLTLPQAQTRSALVSQWRQTTWAVPKDVPAVFCFLA